MANIKVALIMVRRRAARHHCLLALRDIATASRAAHPSNINNDIDMYIFEIEKPAILHVSSCYAPRMVHADGE